MIPKNNLYSGLSEIAGIYDHLNGNLLDSFNKTELDTVGFKIPDKIIKEFKIKMKKFNIKLKSFSPKINSEKDFRDYAHVVMKKAHGESYDVDTTNKVVDDLIKDNPDADYGELIGRLTSGFGNKNFALSALSAGRAELGINTGFLVKFVNKNKDFDYYYYSIVDELHPAYDILNKINKGQVAEWDSWKIEKLTNSDALPELHKLYLKAVGNRYFSENKESYVTCNTTNPTQLLKILNAIKEHGNPGHSFEIIIDAGNENEEKFSWDGDGSDRIESIETDGAKLYSSDNSDEYYVVTHQNGVVDSWFGPYFHSEAEKVEDKVADELESGFTVGIWSLDTLLNKLNKQRKGNYTADQVKSHAEKITFSDKMYSDMTVDSDPSILNQEKSNLDSKSLATKREGMNMNWSVQNPFNLSIEPWLVANVINGKPDGLYVGSLLGDSIDLGSEHISLDIKLGNSQPTDVFVIVREGKAIIFKVSQLTKKDKVFSIGDYDYRFSIVPTEVSYEMQYLIGSWMMASSICHLYHICDNKYAGHVALDEFYKEFPEKIDALAEHFLADNDKAEFRVCVIPGQCPIDYLTRLLQFTLKYVELNEGKIPSSYQSQLDEIVCFTQSILYKLKRLDSGRRIFSIKK